MVCLGEVRVVFLLLRVTIVTHFGPFCLTFCLEFGTREVYGHAIKTYGVVEV